MARGGRYYRIDGERVHEDDLEARKRASTQKKTSKKKTGKKKASKKKAAAKPAAASPAADPATQAHPKTQP